jgi:hypothetical protein
MCEKVFKDLKKNLDASDNHDLIPYTVETLRPWLREVAPDYARKPGPPKKK